MVLACSLAKISPAASIEWLERNKRFKYCAPTYVTSYAAICAPRNRPQTLAIQIHIWSDNRHLIVNASWTLLLGLWAPGSHNSWFVKDQANYSPKPAEWYYSCTTGALSPSNNYLNSIPVSLCSLFMNVHRTESAVTLSLAVVGDCTLHKNPEFLGLFWHCSWKPVACITLQYRRNISL